MINRESVMKQPDLWARSIRRVVKLGCDKQINSVGREYFVKMAEVALRKKRRIVGHMLCVRELVIKFVGRAEQNDFDGKLL
jgi:hypothetical protein